MVYKPSHKLTGPSLERVIYFYGTTYEDRCLMFDALSMCRMTRLVVSRWWKMTIVLEELIEDVEKRLELV